MTEPARILVVDDNKTFAENLKEILETTGYVVSAAMSCSDARAAAKAGFDIALVDMRLPDGQGTDLAGELRALNPDAAVVLLTGYSTVEVAAVAVRAGAFAYLSKPCATEELLLTVEQARRQVALQAEKRELAKRAQMAERLAAIGTMTAGLSHEIRNPLNAAALQLSVLERRVKKLSTEVAAPLLAPLGLVRDEIRRLDQMLEDFLQVARPRARVTRPVDLVTLVGRVLDLLATDAERRGVKLVRQLNPVPLVAGDDSRLRQVVMNLALNALEASPHGAVTFATSTHEQQVQLAVDDTGPGVPQALRDHIFETFFSTKAQGSGLGLPIAHAIVTQHEGTLTVGDAPGSGARFVVRLPRHVP